MSNKKEKIKSKRSKWIRGFAITISTILLLFIALVLFIRSEWGQDIIVNKAVSYITDKTNTKLKVGKIYLTFDGNLFIENLYVEDTKKDTLFYSQSLEASVKMMPLLRGKAFDLDELFWENAVVKINRKADQEDYNFQFLIDAFTQTDSLPKKPVDSSSSSLAIRIGTIDLSNIRAFINDSKLGIVSKLNLGELKVETQFFDLDSMHFVIDEAALKNTDFQYKQAKPFPIPEEETEIPLPTIEVANIILESVSFSYDMIPDNLYASVNLPLVTLEDPVLNLRNQQIELDEFVMKDGEISYKSINPTVTYSEENSPKMSNELTWPDWQVRTEDIQITNTAITFIQSDSVGIQGQFNPGRIFAENININIPEIVLDSKKALVAIDQISFTEKSGLMLQDFQLEANASPSKLKIDKIWIQSNESLVKGKGNVQFLEISQLVNRPELTTFNVGLETIQLGIKDAYYFQPSLADNPYIEMLASQPVNGQLYASGSLQKFELKNTEIAWGSKTKLDLSGSVMNSTTPDALRYDIKSVQFRTQKSDFESFTKDQQLPISIPDTLLLTGVAQGSFNAVDAEIILESSEGSIRMDGLFNFENSIAVDTKIAVDKLQLNHILQNPQLGSISLIAEAKASGASVNNLDATLRSDVTEVNFNGYSFKNFDLDGKIENGEGTINAAYKDENLNMKLKTLVNLDSIAPKIKANLDVIGADLNALGLTQKTVKTQFKTAVAFEGSATQFDLTSTIDDITVVYDRESYLVDPIEAKASINRDTIDVSIDSRFLKSYLSSNADVERTITAINNQLKQYISNQPVKDTLPSSVQVEMELGFKESPVLSEVFLSGLKDSDTIIAKASFNEDKEQLAMQILAPSIRYLGGNLDSLKIDVKGNKKELDFVLDWNGINYDPIDIHETTLKGEVRDQILYLAFDFFDKDEALTSVKSELKLRNDTLYYHLNPKSLLLNKTPWEIAPDNQIVYGPNHLLFENFAVNKGNQSFEVTSKNKNAKEIIHLDFKNLNLTGLTRFLNPDESLASGTINGEVVVEDLFQKTGITADVEIDKFSVAEVLLGELKLDASSNSFNNYDANLSLKGKDLDLTLDGNYHASTEDTQVDFNFNLKKLNLKLLENLAEESISQSSGQISANAKITGSLTEPNYQGSFTFLDAKITPAILGTPLILSQEKIIFDNAGVTLNQFTITDVDKNVLNIDGNVGTKQISNPTFNLKINADDFTAINAGAEDSDLFYGKVNFSSNLTVKGNLEVPVIRGDLSIAENSNFTLIVPETEVSIKEREGVVLFVNKENPDAILTRNEENSSQVTQLQGFDINAKLHVGDQSLLKIIIDQQTEDFFQVHGTGDFIFGMKPSGQMNLAGRYDITDGKYKVSLYNLVKREFDIAPGGSIVWSGDPFEARLDVRAIYKVEANTASIMKAATDANQYNRDLDFLVYLSVDGELLQPEISFQLDMPEENRGYAGGEVYSKVQQLNEQEAELNKQVFSLLVFNRFFPESGSDGSAGGPASIARDNVNRVLSGQLNNFSEKLLGDSGVALDFQLDSYNSYQNNSATANTDLSINAKKKLFDDRLVVQVGSSVNVEGNRQAGQQSAPIIGNVAIEYLLTEDGKYRLKGFRKNEFESVIDGQLIVTGIAFIFNREFNRFRELWRSLGLAKEKKDEVIDEKK